MATIDYLVVGAGLTGSTIARRLADAGRDVLVLDRRSHGGGNVHDTTTPSGLRIHTYGPHYFRCSSPRIWDFVRRFAAFRAFSPQIQCRIGDRFEPWPINRDHLGQFPDWKPPTSSVPPIHFEDACLRKMPRPLYERYILGYTRRQWGAAPDSLEASLARRIRINEPHQATLTPQHRHQGLPEQGYAAFMQAMLAGIDLRLHTDFQTSRHHYRIRKKLIFTGPIDEFFGFEHGPLQYRGQRRVHHTLPDTTFAQPCVQVNHPGAGEHHPIRTIEWKHLLPPDEQTAVTESVITGEYPFSPTQPDQFEYPFPSAENRRLYRKYRDRATSTPGLMICGRLGEYRYLDMDQAIGRALRLADLLLKEPGTSSSGPPP